MKSNKRIITIFAVLILIFVSILSLAACNKKDVIDGMQDAAKQLSAPTGLRVDSELLRWNPVEFASRYTVSIDGHEFYCDDYSYSLNGVKDGDHIFKVKANGDGILYITSPFSEELVLTIEGGAVANSGYYGQFDELTKNESFLGYGFDVINSAVFSDKYVLTSFPIFDNDALMNQRLLKVDSKHSVVNEVQSSELSTFMQQWNASLNVNVGWDGWICAGSVDVSAKYSGGVENAESMYYHVISIENQKFYIVLQSDIATLKSIVSDGFKAALYSDMDPATLFDRYGTHFITSAVMGGKINSYYLYSSTEKKSYHDVSASVSVDVRTWFTSTDVDISGGYQQEAKEQNINIKNSLEVIGGGDFGMLSDIDIGKNYATWEKSLDDHASLMGIKDSGSLIPIWELFDASLGDEKIYTWDYKDEAGKTITSGAGNRAAQLQAYFYSYGLNSYNDLMKNAGLREIVVPESIENIRVNGQEAVSGEYEVYAGVDNAISFNVQPSNALGYTKEAFLSSPSEYAIIDNKNGNLLLKIDAECPHNTVLQVTLSAGTVRKQITVRVVKRFTVTFESNVNGIEIAPYQNVSWGRQIEEPNISERDGYALAGWFTSPYLTEDSRFLFGVDPITDNITLYAKWVKAYYTVTFVTDGTPVEPRSVYYNTKITAPITTKAGFTFRNWCKDPDGQQVFDFANEVITKDITLYANWEVNHCEKTGVVEIDLTSYYTYSTDSNATVSLPGGCYLEYYDITTGCFSLYGEKDGYTVNKYVIKGNYGVPDNLGCIIRTKITGLSFQIFSAHDIEIEFENMAFISVAGKPAVYTASEIENKNIHVTIISSGSLNTLYGSDGINGKDGQPALQINTSQLILTGNASMIINGGNGSNGINETVDSIDGTNGGVGILANNLTIELNCSLGVYGGNGGNGAIGVSGTKSTGGKKGTNGNNGGDGGKGNFAISCKTLYANCDNLTFTGGNGGKGGDGGKGGGGEIVWSGSGNYNAGNGGDGGLGGNGSASLQVSDSYEIFGTMVLISGDGGDGGNGGNGGDGKIHNNGGTWIVSDYYTKGSPGKGGKGGNGGNAGKEIIITENVTIQEGKSGNGGDGGEGGSPWKITNWAGTAGKPSSTKYGSPGAPGADGK